MVVLAIYYGPHCVLPTAATVNGVITENDSSLSMIRASKRCERPSLVRRCRTETHRLHNNS